MAAVVADAGLLDVNGTLIAELLAFILMVLLFARYVYPRIIAIAEQREKVIEQGVRNAEEAEKRLASVQEQVTETLNGARDQAREIVSRAQREAIAEAEDVRAKSRSDAEALLQRAQADIAGERDRAIQELRNEVSTLVIDAASRVIGESLDQRSHQKLIDEALDRVGDGQRRKAGSS